MPRPLAYLTVFVSSASVMVVELVAGRLVAPALGVSLYTWTTVIGVILGGIGLGNYLGGHLADRHPRRRTLVVLLLLGALAALNIILTLNIAEYYQLMPSAWPIVLRFTFSIASVFFVPTCLLGTITPVVIKLSLKDLDRAGGTVGSLYAVSLIGSIVGTFATGFYLIAWLGTRPLIALVAGTLALLALLVAGRSWGKRESALLALLPVLLGLELVENRLASPCLRESNYFCIRVTLEPGDEPIKTLYLDRLLHSYWSVSNPLDLVYPYENAYAVVAAYVARRQPAFEAFSIGGGGYVFPYYLTQVYPQSRVSVAEIDPAVTEVARAEFALHDNPPVEIYHEDARFYLSNPADAARRFDLIIGDAFNDFAVPYHLTTREFDELVKSRLKPGGIYMANIIDMPAYGHFFRAYVRTMQTVFDTVLVLGGNDFPDDEARQTYVVVAGDSSLNAVELAQIAATKPDWARAAAEMKPLRLRSYLNKESPLILSDDYVPTDNLLAPVFGN
ncbi:MAG: fused MFS/spermidine synthase [Chloroflexi bacterium]|nr:fused MFS/spermidine synthase [Chloroflexota bacterium]